MQAKGHKLGTEGRPEQIGWWLGRGRDYKRTPPIDDVAEYGEQMRGWWCTLQASWRREDAKGSWPLIRHAPLNEDWDSLARGGANGLMVFLVGLGWWLGKVEDKESVAELASVVEDVRWILDEIKKGIDDGRVVEMLLRRGGAPKRGRDDEVEKGRKGKKR